jgi:hypothetical protein
MHQRSLSVKVEDGWFEKEIELPTRFPKAEGVAWELSAPGATTVKGHAPLTWSRFRGRVKYHQSPWHSSYIYLIPVIWGAPGELHIPVADDGTFDALAQPASTRLSVPTGRAISTTLPSVRPGTMT